MNQQQENAVRILARECIAQRKSNKGKMTNNELRELIKPYREKAILLGCSSILFTWWMGVENGVIKE